MLHRRQQHRKSRSHEHHERETGRNQTGKKKVQGSSGTSTSSSPPALSKVMESQRNELLRLRSENQSLREEAIHLMKEAIKNYKIEGIQTTLPFGAFVCEHESFTSGNFDTHFVKDYYSPEALKAQQNEEKAIAAAVGLKLYLESQQELKVVEQGESSWMANRL